MVDHPAKATPPPRIALIVDGGYYLVAYRSHLKFANHGDFVSDFKRVQNCLMSRINMSMAGLSPVWEQTDFFHATEDGQPDMQHRSLQSVGVRVELKTFKSQKGLRMVCVVILCGLLNYFNSFLFA